MPHPKSAEAVAAFRARYGSDPVGIAFAPGRVNIIGEHTDYNAGFVLPCAVDLATFIAFRPREDMRVRLFSDMAGEEVEFEVAPGAKAALPFWAHYAWGTGMSLLEKKTPMKGFDGYALSTVPKGGGLSSSASFEVAMALAYMGERSNEVAKWDLAHLCRRAENAFVGVNCGIMDQFACIFGEQAQALMLDCRSLEYQKVPFPRGTALVVADTGVRHALGDSAYHKRQEECREAVVILSELESRVKSLRDVTPGMLGMHKDEMGDEIYRRARHVVTENERVQRAVLAMGEGDVRRLGVLMAESHKSLKEDYEVSCAELDAMAASAFGIRGHFGTRMVGGGFGGCTVSLVKRDMAKAFETELAQRYKKATGLDAVTHIVMPGRGAGLLGIDG